MGKQAKIRAWRKKNGFLPAKAPDSDGAFRVQMDDDTATVMKEQFDAFVAKFGREPGPSDPVLFDPSKDVPTPMEFDAGMDAQILTAMMQAGMDPMLVYASWKTGRMVTKKNSQFLEDADLAEWLEACEEWKTIEAGVVPPPPSLPSFLRPGASA